MRSLVALGILCTLTVQGQAEWVYEENVEWHNGWARDMVEKDGDFVLVATAMQQPASKVLLRILSPQGELLSGRAFLTNELDPDVAVVVFEEGGPMDIWGTVGYFGSQPKYFRYRFNSALQPLDSTLISWPVYLDYFRMDNIVREQDGSTLLMGYGGNLTTEEQRARLLRVDAETEPLVARELYSVLPQRVFPVHGVQHEAGTLVAFLGGIPDEGPIKRTEFVHFDEELIEQSGFVGPNIFTGGPSIVWDSVIIDQPFILPIDNGDLLISGRYGNAGVAVVKTTASGEFIGSYRFPSSFPYNTPARLQAMCGDGSGGIYFCQMENVQPYSTFVPQEPTRIRVTKLDADLNVLCEFVLDGFEQSKYYLPTRIKATSDGGLILMGGVCSIPQVIGTSIWAAKFPPSACATGMSEGLDRSCTIYPNPGVDGFSVLLSGPVVPKASVELYDALGRWVASVRLDNNMGQLDTWHLTSAAYYFQVMDGQGGVLTTGKWLKE